MTRIGQRDPAQRLPRKSRRTGAALVGAALLAAWAGCSDARPVVVVSVDGLTPQVQSVRTTAMLDGKTDVEVFTSGLGQFGLRLPSGASGLLNLTLEGLGADQCTVAGGNGSVSINSGQNRADVAISLTPLATPSCGSANDMGGVTYPVTVTKTGTGTSNGLITSTPAGINCGTQCSANFAQGTKLTLSVTPDYRSLFSGWTGDCTATQGLCQLSAGTTPTSNVTARFTATACSLDRVCQKLPTPLSTTRYRAVWGTAANNVWAVGAGGTIMHWDGALFSPVQSGTGSDLYSIWGSGPNDFWVGSTAGLVLRWNGTTFTPTAITGAQDISGIWGSGPNDVWFLDGSNTLRRWNGSTFAAVNTGATVALTAIWGSSANDFWVTAINGSVLHWLGTAFSIGPSSTSSLLTAIWGSGATDVWAVSAINSMTGMASIIHYDGVAWKTITNTIPDFLSGVSGSVGEVWAVGTNGAIWRSNVATFTKQSSGTPSNLNGAYSSGANDLWAVGDSGVILRREP